MRVRRFLCYFAFVIYPCALCTVICFEVGKEISFPLFPLFDALSFLKYLIESGNLPCGLLARDWNGRADFLICKPPTFRSRRIALALFHASLRRSFRTPYSGKVGTLVRSITPFRGSLVRLTQVRIADGFVLSPFFRRALVRLIPVRMVWDTIPLRFFSGLKRRERSKFGNFASNWMNRSAFYIGNFFPEGFRM